MGGVKVEAIITDECALTDEQIASQGVWGGLSNDKRAFAVFMGVNMYVASEFVARRASPDRAEELRKKAFAMAAGVLDLLRMTGGVADDLNAMGMMLYRIHRGDGGLTAFADVMDEIRDSFVAIARRQDAELAIAIAAVWESTTS